MLEGGAHLILAPMRENLCWGDSPAFGACAGELVCLGGGGLT